MFAVALMCMTAHPDVYLPDAEFDQKYLQSELRAANGAIRTQLRLQIAIVNPNNAPIRNTLLDQLSKTDELVEVAVKSLETRRQLYRRIAWAGGTPPKN